MSLWIHGDAEEIKGDKFRHKRYIDDGQLLFTKLTWGLSSRELDLSDTRTDNAYLSVLQIEHGDIKNNGGSGTRYTFTSNGVDVTDWRRLGMSCNLGSDLENELADKIGTIRNMIHASTIDGDILLAEVPINTSVTHIRRKEIKSGKHTFST